MTASRPSYPRLVSAALGLVACAAATAVAQTPVPQGADSRAVGGSVTTRELIPELVSDYYPAVIQGASPINRITFVLDEDGNYLTSAAWTDTAVPRRLRARTPAAVAGVPLAPGAEAKWVFEDVPVAVGAAGGAGAGGRPRSARVGDFGAFGFPNITSDAVMHTQSGVRLAPNPLSVFIIRLKT